MPNRKLPDWIDAYTTFTSESEPPDSYKRWVAVSAIASALQRKVMIPMHGGVYPNMYVVLVGPSGCRKGTAIKPARDMIRELGIPLSVEATSGAALVRRLKDAKEDSLLGTRMYSHCSLTICSEELTVFLGYNQIELMATLCDWYDCTPKWTKETIGRGPEPIDNVWVNLLGATTPSLIQSTLPQDAIGGGLTSRIVFIFEPRKGKLIILDAETPETKQLRQELMHDLEVIRTIHGEFQLSNEWLESYTKWRVAEDEKPPFKDTRFSGYFNRRPTHIIKLSMIVSASRSNELILSGGDFDRAIRFLREAEIKMPHTFAGFGASPVAKIIPVVINLLETKGEILMSDLVKMFYFDADKELIDKCIATLMAMKVCKVVAIAGDTKIVKM